MGVLGLFIGGIGTAAWLRYIENTLPLRDSHEYSAYTNLPTWVYAPLLRLSQLEGVDQAVVADTELVIVKALVDACFWAPLANTGYLVLTPLSEGKSVEEVRGMLRERFVPVMKTEWCTFFPYNLVSFSLVPPLIRPFTTGFVSMCFAVYISYMTHLEPEPEAAAEAAAEAGQELEGVAQAMQPTEDQPTSLRVAPTMLLEDSSKLTASQGEKRR